MMVTHREEPIPPRSIPRLQYRKRLVHPPRASLFPFFRTGGVTQAVRSGDHEPLGEHVLPLQSEKCHELLTEPIQGGNPPDVPNTYSDLRVYSAVHARHS